MHYLNIKSSRRRFIAINLIVLIALIIYPLITSNFFTFSIAAYALILGTIALSLMVLAGYGGMVSLAQLTVAGLSGYTVAILGVSSSGLGQGWPWWAVVPMAIVIGTTASALIGLIAIRTEGIYTIMITLAIAIAFFSLALQNQPIFNGLRGFGGVDTPMFFGIDWGTPTPFYYMTLAVAALSYFVVLYVSRSPFGLALQAIRDNPRRMKALGFNVAAHRIGAYVLAGLIASAAGVLLVWFNGRISPGTISVGVVIDILVIAVIGGVRRPIGPFLGAFFFVLLETFTSSFIDRERFNTAIGIAFLVILFLSQDGIIGLWERVKFVLLNALKSRKKAN